MRSVNDLRPIKSFDIRFERGGLGDSIARLPVVKYVANMAHIQQVRLFAQDYFVEFAQKLLDLHVPTGKVKVFGLSKMEQELRENPSDYGAWTDCSMHTTLRSHLTDHAFHMVADMQPSVMEKVYLQGPKGNNTNLVPKEYVIITTGFTAAVREWPAKEVNKVIDWCISKGILPVFLGKKESVFINGNATEAAFSDEVNYHLGLDLREKTNLWEAMEIMHGALAVTGVDNGLIHLAGCTEVPIVAGYTTVNPSHRRPYRINGVFKKVVPDPKCSFCQTKMAFVYKHDFRNCYYGDYTCTSQMTGEKFIQHLEEIYANKI